MCLQMLENPNELIIHGYAYQDWIREIPNPQVGFTLFQDWTCIYMSPTSRYIGYAR